METHTTLLRTSHTTARLTSKLSMPPLDSGNFLPLQLPKNLVQVVTKIDNESILVVPSEDEILATTLSIGGDKAPGHDGFYAKFYHSYWSLVGPDVVSG